MAFLIEMYLSLSGCLRETKPNNILKTKPCFNPQNFIFCQNLFGGIIICEEVAEKDWKYFQSNRNCKKGIWLIYPVLAGFIFVMQSCCSYTTYTYFPHSTVCRIVKSDREMK